MIDRKKQIIELSIELVKEYGYDSFSYATLSKNLGITKASIHHHFSTKDDLGLALCTYIYEHMKVTFDAILIKNTSALKKLQEYLRLYEKMMDNGNKICPVASLQAEAQVISKDMQKMVANIDDIESQFIEKILLEGKNSNEFILGGNLTIEAISMAASLKGALLYARIHGKEHYCMISTQLINKLEG